MTFSELKAIRIKILQFRANAPAHKGARRISRDIMRAIRNEREDFAAYMNMSIYDPNLCPIDEWPIPERYAERMKSVLTRAYKELEKELEKKGRK